MIITVDKLPFRGHAQGKRQRQIMEFMATGAQYALVEVEPYEKHRTVYVSLRTAAAKLGVPVYVSLIDREIYLERTDMDDD